MVVTSASCYLRRHAHCAESKKKKKLTKIKQKNKLHFKETAAAKKKQLMHKCTQHIADSKYVIIMVCPIISVLRTMSHMT